VMLVHGVRQRKGRDTAAFTPLGVPLGLLAVPSTTTGLISLFLSFLKIGSVLFGSGLGVRLSVSARLNLREPDFPGSRVHVGWYSVNP
jgi:hypothetical protein